MIKLDARCLSRQVAITRQNDINTGMHTPRNAPTEDLESLQWKRKVTEWRGKGSNKGTKRKRVKVSRGKN